MKRNAFFSVICVMLFITGCTTNHLDNVMINSNAVQVGDSWSPLDSIERAGVIHCETEEDNYSFEVHAYDGSFLVEQQNGKMQYVSDLVIEGVGDAHWENVLSNGEIQPWDGEKTFLGVLIKRDDKYVGYATARRVTLRNSGKNMRKKFCSTRLLRMPLMRWASRSCPRSKSCRQSMRNCWKKRKRPMPSTGVPVKKCESF